jgi:hypothetical protein
MACRSTISRGRLRPLRALLLLLSLAIFAEALVTGQELLAANPRANEKSALVLENGQVKCTVRLAGDQILRDRLEILPAWALQVGGSAAAIETDADFGLDLMFSDWDAPGKANNADNLIVLTKKNFSYVGNEARELTDGTKELSLYFKGVGHSIRLRMTYQLESKAFYVKRSISVLDSSGRDHFLRWFLPRYGQVSGIVSVVKDGGFGQPVAVLVKGGGAFFGLEYPACDDHLEPAAKGTFRLRCSQEYGERIRTEWLRSDWVVEGVTPNPYVKLWFFEYLDDVRVAPLRPYSLYNTWYDLRSPEYPNWSADNVMSETTALKMADLLRRNMIEKNNIKLDAFVLDDGWDIYKSDWVLRKEQWPKGLKPLADELKKTNTSLGVWFGPTGGYSFHNLRVGWMKEHGYEVVNNMMCVAGRKYSALLKKRVTDFVQNDGVGYYKWDGIQFSCSEPDHGHPIDVYSRRAVLQAVAEMCKAVREKNPNIFLNITSGTWMSPWWVKYANTIWMQGADYGFADVPSISSRDASITYRDFVLYEDWKLKGLWFPIANLMTHGIIKGKHESVGTTAEPLDKFTDDVLLYVARGVAMYELYISPDILSDGEWTSISRSLAWARDRFPILMNTELIGGNPMKGEAYGYTHFNGNRGIIAARNPVIEASKLKVELAPSQGLDPKASSLVLERVYPTRWISPKLYKAGETATLPLEGFEMAVYELYPLAEAAEPLLAGATFDVLSRTDGLEEVQVHSASPDVTILNPSLLKSKADALKATRALVNRLRKDPTPRVITEYAVKPIARDESAFSVSLSVSPTSTDGMLAVLLVPDESVKGSMPLKMTAQLDGRGVSVQTERQEGRSQWFKIEIAPGKHDIAMKLNAVREGSAWKGKVIVWFVSRQKQKTRELTLALKEMRPDRLLPPTVWPAGEVRKNVKIGDLALSLKAAE